MNSSLTKNTSNRQRGMPTLKVTGHTVSGLSMLADSTTKLFSTQPSRGKYPRFYSGNNTRNRVVERLLVNFLEQTWEPVFIHDSYACRRDKGVHRAVERLQRFIHQATANGARQAWYLQLDIHNYFMSIDRDILFTMLSAKLNDETVLWLIRTLVYHDATNHCHFRGRRELLEKISAHKIRIIGVRVKLSKASLGY